MISFTATSRLSNSSCALQTAPIPPRPITARSRYRSAIRRSGSGVATVRGYPACGLPNGRNRIKCRAMHPCPAAGPGRLFYERALSAEAQPYFEI